MDLSSYVEGLRQELITAAEAGGEEARAVAERLVGPLESATRLALLESLSAAADEITRDLAPGSVEVRLRGRDPEFVVTPPPVDQAGEGGPESGPGAPWFGPGGSPTVLAAPRPEPPVDAEEAGTSRITLRLPAHLKPRIDEAANGVGLSVNAWLVRAIAAALEPDDPGRSFNPRRGAQFGRRYTGWVR